MLHNSILDPINQGLLKVEYESDLKPTDPLRSDKTVPFHGFRWNRIDFDKPIWIGTSPYRLDDGKPIQPWVGLCSKPLYGYGRRQLSVEDSAAVKGLCAALAENQTQSAVDELFNYLQTKDEPSSSSGVVKQVLSSQTSLTGAGEGV